MAGFEVIAGTSPLVLVAPHGGRRDPALLPWAHGGAGRLRVNDLHTAELAAELAAATGGAALMNAVHDRNLVDLNRVTEADERAPAFLDALAELLEGAIARHGRATLLTVHGWNVVQPAVDLGLGCAAGAEPFTVGPGAAVSPAFAATAVVALTDACAARGIAATVGARYPARARENLLQLFTRRYRDDARARVRALAGLASRVDAVQLELAIPLRWRGAWRRRLIEAIAAVAPVLGAPPAQGISRPARAPAAEAPAHAYRLQFTAPGVCGLAAVDRGGARLLVFPPGGGLALFTGERTGGEEPGRVGPLTLSTTATGTLRLRFDGPMLRFRETTPFLDLEAGLATADLVDAAVALDFAPAGEPAAGGFGMLAGTVRLDEHETPVAGAGFAERGAPAESPSPRLRAALRLDAGSHVVLTLGLDDGAAHGTLARDGRTIAVRAARAALGPPAAPLADVDLEIELESGECLRLRAHAVHRLPVVRARGAAPPVRLEYAAWRLGSDPVPAGWCEFIAPRDFVSGRGESES